MALSHFTEEEIEALKISCLAKVLQYIIKAEL